jgi:glyoxylase-like metal-dependent hydrolase (beta-lactamase superfamily II)
MRWGRFYFQILADTEFRLDGGAMFGVIPKVMWNERKPADEMNRISMTTNCWLIESEDKRDRVLVDTGIGEKLTAKGIDQFAVSITEDRLLEKLELHGVAPDDITHVVSTHLHFDHCGWHTRKSGDSWVPTFPRARYWIERSELAVAQLPNARDRASYDPRNWDSLLAAGRVELFDDEASPVPGLRVVKAPGHTAGMCIVLLEGEGDGTAIFWADLVPTTAHVATPWVMGYDLYPVTTMESKTLWLDRAYRGNWLSIFQHDAETSMARLAEKRPGRYEAVPVLADERS